MKKHKIYKLFAQGSYEGWLKASKKAGHLDIHKELINKNCFSILSVFEKYRPTLGINLLNNTVDLLLYAAEYLWATTGRTVIYPRSAAEVRVISKSSFRGMELSLTKGEMMIIASPPDSDLPPMLAGCFYRSLIDKFNVHYASHVPEVSAALDLQDNIFVVLYQDPDGSFLTYEVSATDFPAYAKAETVQEIFELMLVSRAAVDGEMVTREDRLKQANILKVALNFWMYRLSSPDSFVQQTPPAYAREQFGSKPTSAYSLSFADRLGAKAGSVVEVGIHMRNLRDERYYTTDEWKNKARGSRWIEIGPYTRGGTGHMIGEEEGGV